MSFTLNVYEYFSYKAYLLDLIATSTFKVSVLAEMAGCNRSYFSQMLNGKAQLTSDHIINLSEELGLSDLEKEYFVNLGLLERSSLINTKEILEKKLHQIRQKSLILTNKIKSDGKVFEITDEMKAEYYSNSLYGQIHTMTSIEEFQTDEDIAKRLNIKINQAKKILTQLHKMHLVAKKEGRYIHRSGNIHVPVESPLNLVNHMNWRMRALSKIQDEEGIHYTGTFAISKKDIPKLRLHLLEFIKNQRQIIGSSGSEEVYCFNCDLFSPY